MTTATLATQRDTNPADYWGEVNLACLPETMREWVPHKILNAAKQELLMHFRVDDLSLREQIQLREALQHALRLYIANQSAIDRGEVSATHQINVVQEAVLFWLASSYRPDTYEHPVVEIYLGGLYFGRNMEIWRRFVLDIAERRECGRKP